jgi:hypothetical protein
MKANGCKLVVSVDGPYLVSGSAPLAVPFCDGHASVTFDDGLVEK